MSKFLTKVKDRYNAQTQEEMTVEEYLKRAKTDPSMYASPAERLLKAIGKPTLIDTSKDDRLGWLFNNDTITRYEAFSDFYGMEHVIDQIVSFLVHASQGLEESKQVLYLRGPVGGGKSSVVERLKKLMTKEPFYALKGSPIQESPLGLFSPEDSEELGIPERYLNVIPSGWASKRLEEFGGDVSQFTVVKLYPNESLQVALTKTEPGDENNQDISTLVGKVDIRKLEFLPQNDPDAYSYSGGLCRANQGMLEFVEMFKAPIKMLNPLLTATQEKNYKGTEAIAAIPFDGVIIAHSNESEWEEFAGDAKNEAFLDRITTVKVPYCLRVDEEVQIYEKLIKNSNLRDAPCAPGTLLFLAQFSVLTRLVPVENGSLEAKMRVYNGEDVRDKYPKAQSLSEYQDLAAGHPEGFFGFSTRQAYKVLSKVYNYSNQEIAADPVHLLAVLGETINEIDGMPEETRGQCRTLIASIILPQLYKRLEQDIQTAFLDQYDDFMQSSFDNYFVFAEHWVEDKDYRDKDTGHISDRDAINEKLEKIEKPAGVSNPKDFRAQVVRFCLKYQAANGGKNPPWNSYNKMREVLEANVFSHTNDLLPIISFTGGRGEKEAQQKHDAFVKRMVAKGYTPSQVRTLVSWFVEKGQKL